ncbi:HTH-type transcriptional regulator/antitoxin HipB [Idiomarina aquatica]|uniref:HTH-type transcriptional regulator/antitoxin HipB n=1 Tax=Idiomarina aquatica TaxID=1327752 RepID=A0A4R6P374_9GAMM|nr:MULTISPECIES: helix-turn-helix domain-containing protein [Idiomarina]TDP32214.1 HTH-type transcriptional regulator/antitoxin HipB [Idiomarina aquatica]
MNITRPEQLSAFIKDYRSKSGLTQSDIAKLVGIRVATVSDFENKPQSCKLETFFKILAALNLKIDINTRDAGSQGDSSEWTEEW